MILYYFFRAVEFCLMLLPYAVRKAFFTGLASLAYLIDRQHRAVIRRNLEIAFGPDVGEAEAKTIARYCYRNLLLNFLQVLENQRMTPQRQAELVTFANRDIVDRAREAGRPVIFVSGHFGNWELGATAIASQIMPTVSIHKQLNNPYFDRYLLASRSRLQMHMAEKHGAVKHLTRALKKGEAVSLMIDQNIRPRESIFVDFFGTRVTQTSAPAFLARKYNAAVIPVFIHTEDEKHFTVRFEEEVPVPHTENAEEDIRVATQRQSDVMERIIREEPKFWFWCHRRWKGGSKGIYEA
ncbi:lipid A biosynthesis lauroyl acyltransferase [Thiomicrolovo sp. ZZH C-3]